MTASGWIILNLIALCGVAAYIVHELFKEDGPR